MPPTLSRTRVITNQKSAIAKAVKIAITLVSGITGAFIIKLLQLLMKRNRTNSEVDSLKEDWFTRTSSALIDSWNAGYSTGVKAAKEQGITNEVSSNDTTSQVLQTILGTAKEAIDEGVVNLQAAVAEGVSTDAAAKRVNLRHQLAAEASVRYGASQALESSLASSDTMKMWKTTSKVPCAYCQRLDGHKVGWGEEFPTSLFTGLTPIKIFGGILMRPPLHPNCQCVLLSVPKEA